MTEIKEGKKLFDEMISDAVKRAKKEVDAMCEEHPDEDFPYVMQMYHSLQIARLTAKSEILAQGMLRIIQASDEEVPDELKDFLN